jgi:hypothetical protein
MSQARVPHPIETPERAVLLRWASETGAHGMPVPQDLERQGWRRLAEHPLFSGTWLMETTERPQDPSPPDPSRWASRRAGRPARSG